MHKPLVVLTIFSMMSVSATAQTTPSTNPAQPAKPQMIKKRVCEMVDEDSYSRLGNRKICKTIEVPAPTSGTSNDGQAPAPANPTGNNL
jgi:hypothetical protein